MAAMFEECLRVAKDLSARLRAKRKDELRAFGIALRDPTLGQLLENDEVFATILALATQDYGIKQKDVARMLSVSAASVARWAMGENTPKSYARPAVVKVIAELVELAIQDSKESLVPDTEEAIQSASGDRREGVVAKP